MAKYAMAFDTERCNGCYNCQIACKDEHCYNDFPPYAVAQPAFGQFWIKMTEEEHKYDERHVRINYIPLVCQHCDDAPCVKAAKNGAIYKRDDGIVIIDPVKAVGQTDLAKACPYGCIYINEEKKLAQKCTMCVQLIEDGWKKTRCQQTCPCDVIYFGDIEDPESEISKFLAKNKTEKLHPEYKTNPRASYRGLPKPHLAGSVRTSDNECAKGAKVVLTDAKGNKVETETDFFGDYGFADVPNGKYAIEYTLAGHKPIKNQITTTAYDTDLGEITLKK